MKIQTNGVFSSGSPNTSNEYILACALHSSAMLLRNVQQTHRKTMINTTVMKLKTNMVVPPRSVPGNITNHITNSPDRYTTIMFPQNMFCANLQFGVISDI